jgi:glyoxylase-like metal-dependent hydrolase (beta-lactamase superfamily II)
MGAGESIGAMSAEITPEELVLAAESGEPVQVLDIRAPERLAGGRLDELGAVGPQRFVNFVGSKLLALPDPAATGLDPELPVYVVCARGMTSQRATAFLNDHGYSASSVRGGMAGWMLALVPRALPAPPGFDRLVQFDRVGKGALGYLLVSGDQAILIDPSRNAAPLLAAVEEVGARLVAVADTHLHADYLSGAPGLAQHLGIPYYLHPADAVYPYDGTPGRLDFSPLADGQRIPIGRSLLEVRHTPGHTEGSVTYVAGERAAFTGDFLFIRSVGRPDLAGKAEAWTEELFASLERARREWDPELVVYPAHYAGAGERRADHAVGAPFAELRRANEPLAIEDRSTFRRWVMSRQSKPPEAYPIIKAVNVGLRQVDAMQAEELEAGKNECAVG